MKVAEVVFTASHDRKLDPIQPLPLLLPTTTIPHLHPSQKNPHSMESMLKVLKNIIDVSGPANSIRFSCCSFEGKRLCFLACPLRPSLTVSQGHKQSPARQWSSKKRNERCSKSLFSPNVLCVKGRGGSCFGKHHELTSTSTDLAAQQLPHCNLKRCADK